MIFFKVTNNINIKATDNTLVRYLKPKDKLELCSNNVYCTTYDDFESTKKTFFSVGEQYVTKIITEQRIKTLKNFPKLIGMINNNESFIREKKKENVSFFINQNFIDINIQIKKTIKNDISLVVIGSLATTIGQQICALTALHILHKTLMKKFKSVKIDLYLNCAQNKFYTRDKEIFKSAPFINKVSPLCINTKQLCEYDFYIDMGSFNKTIYYDELNFTDAYLYKFGIDFKTINDNLKFNEIYLPNYKVQSQLKEQLLEAGKRAKLLLYHPYTSDIQRSIPIEISESILRDICHKGSEYIVVTTLDMKKIKYDNYLNLSQYSKSFSDFAYIISQMDAIITADTATYHISDAFAIPTVVLFTDDIASKRIQYYKQTKAVQVKDKAKLYSNFIFKNDTLTLQQYDGWKKIKIKKLFKLLNNTI